MQNQEMSALNQPGAEKTQLAPISQLIAVNMLMFKLSKHSFVSYVSRQAGTHIIHPLCQESCYSSLAD